MSNLFLDDTWPFEVERLLACANIYTEEAYAKVKMDLSKINTDGYQR